MTISAKVIADSMSNGGIRLTTMQLKYPRFVHDEFLTHRMFSRNASSSRAIPIEKMIRAVEDDPAMPVRFGLNGKGMQDHGTLSEIGKAVAEKDWLNARDAAVAHARVMVARKEPAHKQIVNRILAPFSHIEVIVSATEWENFWLLRCHSAADPTMEVLANEMYAAYDMSTPTLRGEGDWHLPYIDAQAVEDAVLYAFEENENAPVPQFARTLEELDAKTTTICCKMSAARCARVSYLTHENKTPSVTEDLALFEKLMGQTPMHASPVEHQATPDRLVQFSTMVGWANLPLHGNFVGWKQHRKMYVGEAAVSHTNAGVGMRTQIKEMEKSFGQNRSFV